MFPIISPERSSILVSTMKTVFVVTSPEIGDLPIRSLKILGTFLKHLCPAPYPALSGLIAG
jgi:hypothetical protein